MTELHLFAGAGGGILAGLLLGHTPVAAVEIEPYCQEVLRARQADGILPAFPIFGDIRELDGRPWAGRVDIVAGGFPCQDISVAGKGAGIAGERSGLWSEMARVIGEIRPRYAFVENVPALVGRGLAVVLGDLAALGYDACWTVLGAHHVGAPHKRDRLWVLAYADRLGKLQPGGGLEDEWQRAGNSGADVALSDATSGGRGARWSRRLAERDSGIRQPAPCADDATNPRRPRLAQREGAPAERARDAAPRGGRWPVESRLGGAAYGLAGWLDRPDPWRDGWEDGTPRTTGRIPHRSDRLKAIGNGQVPQVAAAAWRILMSWEVPA